MEERMIDFNSYEYYIRPGVTDMRKGAHGLALIVQNDMEKESYSRTVFLFCGRNRKTVKAIVWDRNGWLEITKRLECPQGFKWPQSEETARRVTLSQIIAMLEGNDAFREFPQYRPLYV